MCTCSALNTRTNCYTNTNEKVMCHVKKNEQAKPIK